LGIEQLAIAVTGLVALVSTGGLVWNNRQTLSTQRTLALQERVATRYEDMMHAINWVMEIVDETKPIVGYSGQEPPKPPELERLRDVQAKIDVHGSPEVREILDRWAELRREFFTEASLLDSMQEHEKQGVDVEAQYGKPPGEQWKKIVDTRRELHDVVAELREAASAEVRA
jgi:hypothetical protein